MENGQAREDLDQYRPAYSQAFSYYWDETLLLNAYVAKMLAAMEGARNVRALSLGIGRQIVSKSLFESLDCTEYQVIEGSQQIIDDYVRESAPPDFVKLVQGYFEDVVLDGRFDMIEMGFVLEHVDDPGLILRRYRQCLSDSGILFVAVPNARSLHRLLGHAAGMMPDIYSLSPSDLQLGHKRYFDAASIKDLVRECGYEIVREHGLMLKPLTSGQLRSLGLGEAFDQALIEVGYALPDIANGIMLEARKR